jgi:hypothetical protein
VDTVHIVDGWAAGSAGFVGAYSRAMLSVGVLLVIVTPPGPLLPRRIEFEPPAAA